VRRNPNWIERLDDIHKKMEGAVDMLDTIDDRLTFKQLEYFENKRLQ
jgi:hypothetical protein